MKTSRNIRNLAVMAVMCVVTSGAISTAAQASEQLRVKDNLWAPGVNIVQRLERMGRFNILLTALETANLKETVATGGPFTLFAPTDDAFAALLNKLGITAEQLLANPDLGNILLYHVAGGRRSAGQLINKSTQETLYDSQPVLAMMQDLKLRVNGVPVTRANVWASNGIIHVLDGVLLPPDEPVTINSILDVLELDGRFKVLLAALQATGLDDAVAAPGDLTLFAPTDEAFTALLSELGITANQLLADPDLSSILLYHVAAGRYGAVRLLIEGGVETLQGDSLTARLRWDGVYVNDSKVINPNIKAPNGLIHTIDKVLVQ